MGNAEDRQEFTGVGRDLRAAREAAGKQIGDVAQALRIQLFHLEAIEAGRYEDLPSTVYVHGFVRSYSGYLQLDADEMVRRVRLELAPDIIPGALHFPVAPPDSPRPSRRLLLLGMLLALSVFGFWYLNLDGSWEITSAPQVGEPPAALLAPQTETPVPEAKAIIPPASSMSPSPAEASEEQVASEAPQIPSVDELVGENPPEEQDENGAAGAQEDAALDNGMENGLADLITDEGIAAGQSGPFEFTQGSALILEQPFAPPVAAALTPSTPPLIEAPSPDPAPGGAQAPLIQAPIVLQASSDTWMQVSYANGAVMKSWVMRAGENYVPPAGEAGLTLMIGNAGALTVYLDGKAMPSLGAKGAVIRALPLDMAGLKARFDG